MVRMAVGESHAWSWLRRGITVRSSLVFFWYALKAFPKMTLKWEDDALVEGVDIEPEAGL